MRKALVNSPTQVTASSGNVFEDLGFPSEKALALLFKAKILTRILDEVRRKKYRQRQLVELLDEHQPVVSNLLQGKISQMSIEKLLTYADRLGLKLDVQRARPQRNRRRVARPTRRPLALTKIAGAKSGANRPKKAGINRNGP